MNSLGGRTLKFVLYVKFLFIFEARILVLFFFFFLREVGSVEAKTKIRRDQRLGDKSGSFWTSLGKGC